MESDGTTDSARPWVSSLLVFLIAIVAHVVCLQCGWIWDDDSYITANPILLSDNGYADIFVPGTTPQYYPLVFLGFWIQSAVGGIEPFQFHLVNLLMHAGAAVLLLAVLRRLAIPAALWVALLFAAHPMGVESVAWATERKNVQSMLLALASVLLFLRFLDAPASRRLGTWIAAFLCFVAALLSKTTAVFVAPCLVLAILWMRRPLDLRTMACIAPYFVAGLVAGLHTSHVEKTLVGATGSEFALPFAERLQVSGHVALFYLTRFAFPWEQVFIYPRLAPDASSIGAWIPFAVAVVVLGACVARWKRDRAPLSVFLWYGAALFPALGFFDVWPFRYSFVADHFAYAAMPVLAIAVIALLRTIVPARAGRLARAIGIATVAACIALSWRATAKYEDERTLWTDTVERNPSAWIAHNNLATIALGDAEAAIAAGDDDALRVAAEAALAHASMAGELKPDEFTNAVNRSEALRLLGRDTEALAEADLAATHAPLLARVHWLRGRLLDRLSRPDEARAALARSAELSTNGVEERRARLDLMRVAAKAGDLELAIAQCRRLVAMDPRDADAIANLGSLLVAAGQRDEGRRMLLQSLLGGRGFTNDQTALNAATRYLRLAIDATLGEVESGQAGAIAEALLRQTQGDASVRYLQLALRLRQGDATARGAIEEIERGARAAGAAELADDIAGFLSRNPPGRP